MRELVHGRGREAIARAQAANEPRRKQQRAVIVNDWITEIGSDRVFAVRGIYAFEVLGDFSKRFIPTDALPTLNSAANRMSQPIFVEVKVL